MAAVYNFKVDQGSTKRFSIVYKESDGSLKPLDGYSVRGQVRARATDAEIVAEFEFEVDLVESRIDVTLPAEALVGNKNIRGRSYNETSTLVYDIELFNSEEVIRLLNGNMLVSPEVTK